MHEPIGNIRLQPGESQRPVSLGVGKGKARIVVRQNPAHRIDQCGHRSCVFLGEEIVDALPVDRLAFGAIARIGKVSAQQLELETEIGRGGLSGSVECFGAGAKVHSYRAPGKNGFQFILTVFDEPTGGKGRDHLGSQRIGPGGDHIPAIER